MSNGYDSAKTTFEHLTLSTAAGHETTFESKIIHPNRPKNRLINRKWDLQVMNV